MERAPLFLRGMVRRLAEKKGQRTGIRANHREILDQFKNQMMGSMGGEDGMAEAADQMAKGQFPWTAAAKERLAAVPEFMRGMINKLPMRPPVRAAIWKSTSTYSRRSKP